MKHCNEVLRSAVARVQAVVSVVSFDTTRGFWRFRLLTTETDRTKLAERLSTLDVKPFRLHGFKRINDGTGRMEVQYNADTADLTPIEARLERIQRYEQDHDACSEAFLSNKETAKKQRKKKQSVRGNTDKQAEKPKNDVKGE